MYRKVAVLFLTFSIFLSCEEGPLETKNTAPKINFAFFVDGSPRKPDSAFTYFNKRIFEDSLSQYAMPLPVDSNAVYAFFVDSLYSEVALKYHIQKEREIDRLIYNAYYPMAAATNVDSLVIICTDTITCNTNEAIINLYF